MKYISSPWTLTLEWGKCENFASHYDRLLHEYSWFPQQQERGKETVSDLASIEIGRITSVWRLLPVGWSVCHELFEGDGNISVLDWFKLSFYSNFPVKQKQNSRIMASIFNRTWVQWSRFMDRRMIKLEDIVVAKSLWPSVWSTIHTSWPFWSRAELGFL